nr:retrovirus-related Pol polyprotein from transposon TNT 1-94 [Tanacetum cinerariifolium]
MAAQRDELRKLKGKAIVDNAVTTHTIDPKMLKVDVEPIAPRLLNIRTVHSDYLRLTQEQAVILREVVKQGKSQSPLNNSLDHAYVNNGAKVILFRITNLLKSRGISMNQSKYASEIVKKYGMLSSDSVDTPLVEKNKLDEDLQGKLVDGTL